MKVCVRLFAAAKQAAGCDRLELELPDGATIGQLRRRLTEEFPQMSAFTAQVMFAVDAEYAPDSREITPQSDVACIPPVSGG